MTTADPEPTAQKRGRHAKTEDPDDGDVRTDEPAEQDADDAPPRRVRHSLGHHPGGAALLTSAGLVTGIGLVPLLLDQLHFGVAVDAARTARSMAAPWPADAAPWFWPAWVAVLALVVSAVVVLLGVVAVRLPDLAVLVLGAVLALTSARAAWATLDVIRNGLWELIPVCIVALLAVGSAVTAAARWRSGPEEKGGEGPGGVAAVVLAAWLVVVLVLLGGAAVASSARTHAFGDAQSPPQGLPGLLSVRAADAPVLDDLHGRWLAQLAAAEVADDDAASDFAGSYAELAASVPVLLVRGDDTGVPDLDDSVWLTMARQPFDSSTEAQNWCAENGRTPETCVPRLIS